LLSNAWDASDRVAACERFGLAADAFEARHRFSVADFERGAISLREYLARVVFNERRNFAAADFESFMKNRSREKPASLALLARLKEENRLFLATINNESRELNDYRIERFGLRRYFDLFVSSSTVGLRKPEPAIYRLALALTHRDPPESLLIDDREENVLAAERLGMRTHHFSSAEHLERNLAELGLFGESRALPEP
jgi:putative hydrolase of the HAD superfamily